MGFLVSSAFVSRSCRLDVAVLELADEVAHEFAGGAARAAFPFAS